MNEFLVSFNPIMRLSRKALDTLPLKDIKDSDLTKQGDFVSEWDENYFKSFTESIKENLSNSDWYMDNWD